MSTPQYVKVPGSFYKAERDRLYVYWPSAFVRELFQNSIDADSKNINIDIYDAKGKGSFNRSPSHEDIIRIVFDDDGAGMDEEVLRKVYFRPGETTKNDGSSIGGYGRARLMTCFSQARYAIYTQNLVVEGEGAEFTIMPLDDAIADKERAVREAPTALEQERLLKEYDALKARPAWHQGCCLEIDIDPNEYPDRPWRNISKDQLENALGQYLDQSQLYINGTQKPLKVFVNNNEWTNRLPKGKGIRELSVKMEDGSTVPMATVHANKSQSAPYRGKAIMRIDGAPMIVKDIQGEVQLIIELNKEHSRNYLTSNRDGFKPAYEKIINDYLDEVLLDYRTALEDKDQIVDEVIQGGKGNMIINHDFTDYKSKLSEDELKETLSKEEIESIREMADANSHSFNLKSLNRHIDSDTLDGLIEKIKEGQETFLDEYWDRQATENLKIAILDGSVERAFYDTSRDLREFLLSQLAARSADDSPIARQMHNLHIRSDRPNQDIKRTIRRYNPENWDTEKGYGGDAMALQSAWQVCCKHAGKTLMSVMSHDPNWKDKELKISTGWLFKPSEGQYIGETFEQYRTEAMHIKKDDTEVLLLNPVRDDGKKAFKLSNDQDLQRLMTLALHEVSHICAKRHDSHWAEVMTRLVMAFDFQKSGAVSKEIKEAISGVREIFKKGKATVQHADRTPEGQQRPVERLLSMNAPTATTVVGSLSTQENCDLGQNSAAVTLFKNCVTQNKNGLMEIDCESLRELENNMTAAALNKSANHEPNHEHTDNNSYKL